LSLSDEIETRTALRVCPMCESTCGLQITLAGSHVVRTEGDVDDVFSRGFMCPKGASLGEIHDDPDRLRRPVVRRGDEFVEVTWDEAFERVRELFDAITQEHGRESIAMYFGNQIAHTLSGLLYPRAFLKTLGSPNLYTASSVDALSKDLSNGLLYGDRNTLAVPDLDRTDFLVVIGANPIESNGSLTTAPGWPRRLRALQERGGELVVIDPVRTRTAELADLHLRPRVGSDAALLASIVQVLFEEDLVDLGRLADFVTHVDEVRAATEGMTPEALEAYTSLPAASVRELGRRLAAADGAAVYARLGTTATRFGSIASWLVDVLNILTGNLDREGGSMFPLPASGSTNTQGTSRFGPPLKRGRFSTRVSGVPELFGELPLALMPEEIDTPGAGRYRGLLLIAGNPVVSCPDSERLERALGTLDALIAVDPYINDSTRHAHVILPPPSHLEKSHFDTHFAMWSVRNTARYSPALLPLEAGQLHEWEILCRLASAFDGNTATIEEIDDRLIRSLIKAEARDTASPIHGVPVDDIVGALEPRLGPERILDFRLRIGPYGDAFGRRDGTLRLDLLQQHPHGIDFGPMEPRLPDVLRTPEGVIDLAPALLVEDLARLRDDISAGPQEGLVLIGRRHLRSKNSWLHNVPSLMTGRDRSRLHIHPDDARARGLRSGSRATVSTPLSSVEVLVEVSARMAPGVVSLPHGWLHRPDEVRLATASSRPGVNKNRIIPTEIDVPSGNAVFNGVPVEVTLCPPAGGAPTA